MNAEGTIDAKVEAVVDVGHEAHVIVCLNHSGNFSVFDGSTLGGKPIRPWLSQPRALTEEGKPRYDIYNFILASKEDMNSFQVGETHSLVVTLIPSETNTAEPQDGAGQPATRSESK